MRLFLVVLLRVLVGCGGASGGPPDAGIGADASGGAAGEITVLDGGGLGHMWFAPVVFGGFPDVASSWYTEVATAGACRLLAYAPGSCEPACTGVCVAPGECRAWPRYRSAGELTVDGLAAPVQLAAPFDGRYVTYGGLPDPLFASGATISLAAAGAEIPAFTVSTGAVARLSIPAFDADLVAVLADGADTELAWPDPDPTARVHVVVHSGGAIHGLPPATFLECDAADTGTLAIPRAIVEALPGLGTGCTKGHDCAKLGVMRYHRAVVATAAGDAALVVGAGRNYPVMHATGAVSGRASR